MKKQGCLIYIRIIGFFIIALFVTIGLHTYSHACDIAVVSASASSDGRPFIWKNRDNPDSYKQEIEYFESNNPEVGGVIIVKGEINPYQSLVICSGGLNEAGFAIANTTVYEGNPIHELWNGNTDLMKYALEECVTVDDFEYLLAHWHEINPCNWWDFDTRWVICANYVVIDAHGGAALFEAYTGTGLSAYGAEIMYEKFDANTAMDDDGNYIGFVNRTNSHQWIQLKTDTPRELRAYQLMLDLKESNELSYRNIMQTVAKDVCGGNCDDYDNDEEYWTDCEDDFLDFENYNTYYCISRAETNLSLLAHGVAPGQDASLCTFWCSLGEPSVGVSVPYFVGARDITYYAWADYFDDDGIPTDFDSGSLLCRASNELEIGELNDMYNLYENNGYYVYIDHTVNYNDLLGVQLWTLLLEDVIFEKTEKYLNDMANYEPRITEDNFFNFTHYCAQYVYNNYIQCSSDYYAWDFEIPWDVIPPEVTSTYPASDSVDVAINTNITATFSESLDSSTVENSTFMLYDGSGYIDVEVIYDDLTYTATLYPYADLDYSTVYTATITTGVKDIEQNFLVSDYTWSFVTGIEPDLTSPELISFNPASDAADVAINSNITATFSESINPSTINASTFRIYDGVKDIDGQISYSDSDHSATFDPQVDLDSSITYTATITTGVEDLVGNPLEDEITWSFTTGEWSLPADDIGGGDGGPTLDGGEEPNIDNGGSSSDGGGCNLFAKTRESYSNKSSILPGLMSNLILMLFPIAMILLHRVFRRRHVSS